MQALPPGIKLTPTSIASSLSFTSAFINILALTPKKITSRFSGSSFFLSAAKSTGACRVTQAVELFPRLSPEIVVREAKLEDSWEVVDTHCSSFFPEDSFPLSILLRIDRLIGMLFVFYPPSGCKRTCLVAVDQNSVKDTLFCSSEELKIGSIHGASPLKKGYVTGILTVDTMAYFLPRKGPFRQRRSWIAYISNVAVREQFRRKGIAKKLVAKAEAQAKGWGCRAIALHCDLDNPIAKKLYESLGFKCIKVPEGATWPQPKTSPDMRFNFMMKLLRSSPVAADLNKCYL